MMTKAEEQRFLAAYYAVLKGAVIVDVDGGAEFPRLVVKTTQGEELIVEVSRDEEGNGPGFLFGLPVPPRAAEPEGGGQRPHKGEEA